MRIVSIDLQKSNKPVSKVCDLKDDLEKFVGIKSIHNGLTGFLKHAGSFIKLCRWYVSQKFSEVDSVIFELKSPKQRNCHIFLFAFPIFFQENSDDLR